MEIVISENDLYENYSNIAHVDLYYFNLGRIKKMIKRTMYGRCRKRLLEAKLRYVGKHRNG